ncbi:sodium pump decarboxylases, gamma subunit [Shewanella sp. ANA-3]|uniref:OadG family protein n=1 Tax=unclassified Shewanella TaxID=196818 RepID=UPI00005E15EB|nr:MULTISPECIES: OadG family transporter subunit [unclassified Shewanella]ABK49390.1 sodium pump decarboxylases, gamma subunit [Shewanella sp. ANA-3]MDH0449743.1 OadG family transporter subunit [Shewanella sp. GD04112]
MKGELTQQLLDAVGIMLLGMGLVYLFLSVLILGVHLVAKWCREEPKAADPLKANDARSTGAANTLDPKLVAAISLAVQQYRSQAK